MTILQPWHRRSRLAPEQEQRERMDQYQPIIATRLWARLRWSEEMLYLSSCTALRSTPVPMQSRVVPQ
jgi:hypothetical protein